jgi:hypothetical protein
MRRDGRPFVGVFSARLKEGWDNDRHDSRLRITGKLAHHTLHGHCLHEGGNIVDPLRQKDSA